MLDFLTINVVVPDESYFVYAGKNSSKPEPDIVNALTPSLSNLMYESVQQL